MLLEIIFCVIFQALQTRTGGQIDASPGTSRRRSNTENRYDKLKVTKRFRSLSMKPPTVDNARTRQNNSRR